MLLALRVALSRWRSRGLAAPSEPADRTLPEARGDSDGVRAGNDSDGPAAEHADALWRAARGERSPFRRDRLYLELATHLVEAAGPELLRFCERHVGDTGDAEDVAQQAFIELWQMLPRFEGRSAIRTFLFGIALNLCRRKVRSETRAHRRLDVHEDHIREEVHPEPLGDSDPEADLRERLAVLERTLAVMDPRDAWLLRARLVEERGYAEILPAYQARYGAHITSQEGLRTAFHHARKRLEALLGGSR